ncbi:MAG TPA: hypothetical protein QGH10_25025, partial [Armatimonadota bacterium]|nr:hypothetical protein [Armatimonadota bacterium]
QVLVELTRPGRMDVRTIRTKDYKYTRLNSGHEVLIDLKEDPDEFVNLASDPASASLLAEARLAMIDALMDAADPLPPAIAPY